MYLLRVEFLKGLHTSPVLFMFWFVMCVQKGIHLASTIQSISQGDAGSKLPGVSTKVTCIQILIVCDDVHPTVPHALLCQL